MLTLDLKTIFNERAIQNPYTFLVKSGLSPQSATKILNSQTRVFRLDHIEIICDKLNCTPNDLLTWTPKRDAYLAETHSLNKLKQNRNNFQLQDTLKTMSLEQLNEIANIISKKQTDK
ncbi:MAG: helix-turn-helix transcriptional regulator [Bacteroidota bacterium]